MKFLLDTCALIWAINDPDRLSKKAKETLAKADSEIYVSAISSGEIACLVQRNRIEIEGHWKTWFNKYVELNQWECMSVDLEVIQEAYCLPDNFHQDPADRMIVATARINKMKVVTADQKIISYPHCDTIW